MFHYNTLFFSYCCTLKFYLYTLSLNIYLKFVYRASDIFILAFWSSDNMEEQIHIVKVESFIQKHFFTNCLQVRTFYRSCNGKASCNCAVAIKVDDDIILFDKCGSKRGSRRPLDIQLILNGELTPGTKIFRYGGGKKYQVDGLLIKHSYLWHIVFTDNPERLLFYLWEVLISCNHLEFRVIDTVLSKIKDKLFSFIPNNTCIYKASLFKFNLDKSMTTTNLSKYVNWYYKYQHCCIDWRSHDFFKVYLPHGAIVKITKGKGKTPEFINVQIKSSSADYSNVQGGSIVCCYFFVILSFCPIFILNIDCLNYFTSCYL